MNNWKDKLNQIEAQLKKEKIDGSCISNNSSICSRSNVSLYLSKRNLQEIIKGGNNQMISAEDVLKDYEEIAKDVSIQNDEKIVKIFRLVLKLLLNIRTNQSGGAKKEVKITSKPQ